MMTRGQASRAVVTSAACGASNGVAVTFALVLFGAESWDGVAAMVVLGSVVGATTGALAGPLIGVPVAMLSAILRARTGHWRLMASIMVAGVSALITSFLLAGGPDLGALVAVGATGGAAGAWWGLGWTFGGRPLPVCLMTPSARQAG